MPDVGCGVGIFGCRGQTLRYELTCNSLFHFCQVSLQSLQIAELRLHFSLFFFSQPDIRTLSPIPSAFSSATPRVPARAEVKCTVPTRMVMVVSQTRPVTCEVSVTVPRRTGEGLSHPPWSCRMPRGEWQSVHGRAAQVGDKSKPSSHPPSIS